LLQLSSTHLSGLALYCAATAAGAAAHAFMTGLSLFVVDAPSLDVTEAPAAL
jgi:hypothetical protein